MKPRNGWWVRATAIIAVVLTIAAAVTFVVRADGRASAAIANTQDQETRLRAVETNIGRMAGDIRVIRTLMEERLKEKL